MSESSVLVETIEDTNPDLLRKCDVLDGVFMEYFDDPRFRDFVVYNDLALPLAHMISHSIITKEPEPMGILLIDEAYSQLLGNFGVTSDKAFQEVTEILEEANEAIKMVLPPINPEDEVEDERL